MKKEQPKSIFRRSNEMLLEQYVGKTATELLLKAIENEIPIMICDRRISGVDSAVYKALKQLGAPLVFNYDMVQERRGAVTGVYCTLFVEDDGESVLGPYDSEKGFPIGTIYIDKGGHAHICNYARREPGELSTDDLVRISRRIIGVLEEEHCTVAQVAEILRFAEEAAAVCTLVKPIKISETD